MSALSAIDELIAFASRGVERDDPAREMLEAAHEARAALVDLIEAATRANGEHSAPHDCYATGPLTGDRYRDFLSCPGCELAVALARCKGTQS